ncbi:MAG: SH3 domain-containing protein [Spirochaetales bacterium]|nr:SH3 domain-containing protein [Spirochaetales bacterium]
MSKRKICFLIILLVGVSGLFAAPLRVQVQDVALRAKPSYLGTVLTQLPYGSRVQLIQSKGAWTEVTAGDMSGWLPSASVSQAEIEMNIGNEGATTSSNENALAGKGFTEQIEQNYQKERHVDYTWVNRMEKIQPPETILESFVRNGPHGDFQ